MTWTGLSVVAPQAEINNAIPGQNYTVRVATVTPIGAVSGWVTESIMVTGKTDPPGAPSGLAGSASGKAITLSWLNPPDPDLAAVEIWMSATNDRSAAVKVWNGFASEASVPVETGTHYCWAKARDTTGNESAWHPASATGGVAVDNVGLSAGANNFNPGLSVTCPNNTLTTVLSIDYACKNPAGQRVTLTVFAGCACPVATTGIALVIEGTEYSLYDKSGLQIGGRFFSAPMVVELTVPGDGEVTVALRLRQESGFDYAAEDPFLFVQEVVV